MAQDHIQPRRIAGLRATDFIRVAVPLTGGLLGVGAFVLSARGNSRSSQLLLASWAWVTSVQAASETFNRVRRREIGRGDGSAA